MATFSKIDGAEPSTVTFQLATVTQDRGGNVQHQEIVTLGGTESTLAVAAVLSGTPASTAWALAVREVAPTTSVRVTQSSAADLNVTVAGYVAPSTTVSVSTGSVRVHQSTAADLNVTVAGYVAPSTIVTVSTGSVRVHQSSAADLNVTVSGYSTTVNVSSVAGVVTVAPNASSNSSAYMPVRLTNGTAFLSISQDYTHGSTLTASTVAGPTVLLRASSTTPPAVSTSDMFVAQWGTLNGAAVHTIVTDSGASVMDSTNTAIKVNVVAGAAGGSTIVTVSTGSVRVHQSSAADLNVTVSGYSTTANVSSLAGRVAIAGYHAGGSIVNVTDSTNNAINVNVVAGSAAGDTTATVSFAAGYVSSLVAPTSGSSGLIVRSPAPISDSTNNALRVNVVAGSVAGDTTVTASFAAGYVSSAAPASNSSGLIVRQVDYVAPSTVVSVSTGSVRVHQSSAADLNVTVAGYSTVVSVSTGSVRVHQSSAADLNVTASQNSTAWSVLSRVTTSSGGGVEGSTSTPAQGVTGLHVRQVVPTLNSTTIVITSTNSTSIYPVISSVAGLRHKVFAYFIGSTHTSPSTLIFCSSASASGFDHWHVNFGSGSSGITGANLALNPPGYIFAGIAQNALNVKIEGGSSATSTVVARISISWFDEA
jgi:hypothetical protein